MKETAGLGATYISLVLLGYGWVMNLIGLINTDPWVWTAKTIIGCIGVAVPPVGTIMGWFVW